MDSDLPENITTNSPREGETGTGNNNNMRVYEGIISGEGFEGNSGSIENRVSDEEPVGHLGVDVNEGILETHSAQERGNSGSIENRVSDVGGYQDEDPVGDWGFDVNEGILEANAARQRAANDYFRFISYEEEEEEEDDDDDDDVIVGNSHDWEIAAKQRHMTREDYGVAGALLSLEDDVVQVPEWVVRVAQARERASEERQAQMEKIRAEARERERQEQFERLHEEARERERKWQLERFGRLARGRSTYGNDYFDDYGKNKVQITTTDDVAEENLKNFTGPFSSALEMIRERNIKQNDEELISMESFEGHRISARRVQFVPSLLDLSLKALFKFLMKDQEIASLDLVPDWLKRKLVDMLCDSRRMNVRILDLVLRDSPTHVHIKDCTWMTEEQFDGLFAKLDMDNLRVLQLDLCGKCPLDYLLPKSIAKSSNSLPCLSILSLRGACQLSDDTLKALVTSAPVLKFINFAECPLLTHCGIEILADSLAPSLRELYVDDCPEIDGMLMLPSLKKFEHLEVLSVARIQNVCDEFIRDITVTCGRNLKELDLADCLLLTDSSLEFIGNNCPQLCSLDISNLDKLTDMGIHFLTNGCRSIQTLKLHRNRFSDEAVAAFLEASGKSLKRLSLNGVKNVGHSTALSLARCSRKLTSLDLSWCRRITDEALILIMDSCLSLRLLKLFGCTQITDIFLKGYTNSPVKIIGVGLTSIPENISILEPGEGLLQFSPYYGFVKFD